MFISSKVDMQFEKKKSILKYLGKDGKDVRALSRMIERWEVKFDWTYYSLEAEREADGVADEIKCEPQEGIKIFLPQEKTISSKVDTDLKEELDEALVNAKYREDKCREYARKMWIMMEVVYNIIKPKLKWQIEPFDEFKDFVYSRVRELDWDVDE